MQDIQHCIIHDFEEHIGNIGAPMIEYPDVRHVPVTLHMLARHWHIQVTVTYLIVDTTFEETSLLKSVFNLFLDDPLFSKLVTTIVILGFEEIRIGVCDNFSC